MTDQENNLQKSKEDCRLKNLVGYEMSSWHYLPDEQMLNKTLDQQDWEFKLRERGNENEVNAAYILPKGSDVLEKIIEMRE